MTTTPQVLGPDGVLREEFVFSTTMPSRFFSGTADSATADIEVSIRGSAYTSDPDFVAFDGEDWVIPNPEAYPDGLDLVVGGNVLLIRAVVTSGSVSTPASVTVRLIQASDLGVVADPVGPDNHEQVVRGCRGAATVVCAWGDRRKLPIGHREWAPLFLGHLRARGVRRFHALALTRAGDPGHPLYLPASARPLPWDP